MAASRTTLRRLKNCDQYLATLPQQHRSAYFEHLVAEAFSHILHLDLYTADDDDPSVPYRVMWHGRLQPIQKAPLGEDALALAHGYTALVEPTLKVGSNQWTQEFSPCCQHYDTFVETHNLEPNEVYVVLIAPEMNIRTWESIRHAGFNWVLMTVTDLVEVLRTSILAFTMTHSHVRQLLNSIIDCSQRSDSLEEFRNHAGYHMAGWQKEILQMEKRTFLAVRCYRVMCRIGRTHVGIGEIFEQLERDPVTKEYIRLAGAQLGSKVLEESVLERGLACKVGQGLPREMLLCPVPLADFEHKEARIVRAVEEIHG